jgi:hypothetical protein
VGGRHRGGLPVAGSRVGILGVRWTAPRRASTCRRERRACGCRGQSWSTSSRTPFSGRHVAVDPSVMTSLLMVCLRKVVTWSPLGPTVTASAPGPGVPRAWANPIRASFHGEVLPGGTLASNGRQRARAQSISSQRLHRSRSKPGRTARTAERDLAEASPGQSFSSRATPGFR